MKYLATILERLEAGSEVAIRQHLDEALGAWTASHRAAHTIVAVSENSVAWADQDTNLFIAHYALSEGVVQITDVKKVLNVRDEAIDTAFIAEMANDIIASVSENKEDEAKAIIGIIFEYQTKAIHATRMVRINEWDEKYKKNRSKTMAAGHNIMNSARKTARKSVFKTTKSMRSEGAKAIAALDKPILEAVTALPGAAVNLMVALDALQRAPVFEGFICEKDNEKAFMMKGKGKYAKAKQKVPHYHEETEKDIEEAISEGRYHSTGVKMSVAADQLMEKGNKEPIPSGEYEIAKSNSRTTHLLARKHKDGPKVYAVSTSHLKKINGKTIKDGKAAEPESIPEGGKPDNGVEQVDTNLEGIVVVNLNSLNEHFSRDDFFRKASMAWEQFRSEPITEETAKLLSEKADADKVLASAPFLGLCTEEEVYESIAPHLDAFNPNEIKAVAHAIVEAVKTDEAKKDLAAYLDKFADLELKEAILAEPVLSRSLDALFLEAGDQFDLGSADDLGADDLDDDSDTDGMGQGTGVPGDDLQGTPEDDDMMGDDQQNMVDVQLNADEAREQFKKILSVVGDEIEDNDEFKELKDKLDDDSQEITGDDVTNLLKTVTDYFQAVGKDMEDKDEKENEKQSDNENLDDMDNDELGQGGDHDDTEGDTNDLGSDTADDLELGK